MLIWWLQDKEHKSNIVRMYGYFYFRNHLCITFEPLSINLYEFIKNNGFKGVSLALIRRFAIQLLVALKCLRRERIVHCDLKPENVLLKAPNKATIKLIDFGSSCFEVTKIEPAPKCQSHHWVSPFTVLWCCMLGANVCMGCDDSRWMDWAIAMDVMWCDVIWSNNKMLWFRTNAYTHTFNLGFIDRRKWF